MTSGYAYESADEAEGRFTGASPGYQYSRYSNPTVTMFEERMAALEGAPVARATASGMAAVSGVFLSALRAGDHVVGAKAMFGACRYVIEEILARFGITHTLVDGGNLDEWSAAMKPNTKMLFLETPASGTPQNGTPASEGFGDLQQGNLEQANVEAVKEISDLIAAQRAYEMNAKVITATDQMLQSTANLFR